MRTDLDTIRQAAALIRDRAQMVPEPSPWTVRSNRVVGTFRPGVATAVADVYPTGGSPRQRATATHIASWHPDVALLVADWLDTAGADLWAHGPLCCTGGCEDCDDVPWAPHVRRALALAHACLTSEKASR